MTQTDEYLDYEQMNPMELSRYNFESEGALFSQVKIKIKKKQREERTETGENRTSSHNIFKFK